MATTSNFGWTTPNDTDLVRDGASAIRSLGSAIDSSLYSLNPAGKNKIINGDFAINQRNFTSVTTSTTYLFDRFAAGLSGGTVTYTPQTFTPGTAPVSGYEAQNFLRTVVSGQSATSDFAEIVQRIENVRTLAGQTVTFSVWAKADAAKNIVIRLAQNFGVGGSATVNHPSTILPITTFWQRYSFTVSLGNLSGKTIGANSFLNAGVYFSAGSGITAANGLGLQSGTFDVWGWQVEAGNVATAFQTATGTLQGELAACQRYYWRTGYSAYTPYGQGISNSATAANIYVNFPTAMRVTPTAIDFANLQISDLTNYGLAVTGLTLDTSGSGTQVARLDATNNTGATQWRTAFLRNANNVNGYLGFSAEL